MNNRFLMYLKVVWEGTTPALLEFLTVPDAASSSSHNSFLKVQSFFRKQWLCSIGFGSSHNMSPLFTVLMWIYKRLHKVSLSYGLCYLSYILSALATFSLVIMSMLHQECRSLLRMLAGLWWSVLFMGSVYFLCLNISNKLNYMPYWLKT